MLENIYFPSSRCFVNFWGIFIRGKALRTATVFFFLWTSLMIGTTTFLAVPLCLRHIELV